MTLQDIIQQLDLTLLTRKTDFSAIAPVSGYASDLLSCVMAGARRKSVWVTLQAHANIVAVAALLDLSAVIITEGAMPDPSAIAKADEEGIILLSTQRPTFEVVGRLWEMGLRTDNR
ncbi:MAG: DRTGG domain-containing protein [Candidatus Roseilinea sp.]|uniref:DRTGG domain-containing protein n=1 Tax=Candidatus Roseilinea sp. TaxID=2838777 RepID=UPI00404AAF9E